MSLHKQSTGVWKNQEKKKRKAYGSGKFFPSSHFCIRRRSLSPGLDMSLHYDRGWCCSHLCLVATINNGVIYVRHIKQTSCWKLNRQAPWRKCGLVLRLQDKQSYSLISQWSPSQPSPQMHWYTLTLSIHVPPLRHGLLSQSLMSEDGKRCVRFTTWYIAISCRFGLCPYSRGSRCLWNPLGTRSWTGPRPDSDSDREVHKRLMRCNALLLVCCWMPRQPCSYQSLQRGNQVK